MSLKVTVADLVERHADTNHFRYDQAYMVSVYKKPLISLWIPERLATTLWKQSGDSNDSTIRLWTYLACQYLNSLSEVF